MSVAEFDRLAGDLNLKAYRDDVSVQSVLMGAAQDMGREMADTAPSKRVGASVMVQRETKAGRFSVSGRAGGGVTVGPTHPLSHLFEFGTGPRTQRTTGRYTGVMSPRPFVWPAVDRRAPDMLAEIERAIGGL